MNRKLSRALALASVLAFSSVAFAQEDTTTTFSISSLVTTLGPLAAIIWLILFGIWGGFRYLYWW